MPCTDKKPPDCFCRIVVLGFPWFLAHEPMQMPRCLILPVELRGLVRRPVFLRVQARGVAYPASVLSCSAPCRLLVTDRSIRPAVTKGKAEAKKVFYLIRASRHLAGLPGLPDPICVPLPACLSTSSTVLLRSTSVTNGRPSFFAGPLPRRRRQMSFQKTSGSPMAV